MPRAHPQGADRQRKEFADRFTAHGERAPTGNHLFDQACAERGIEHRLVPPRRPQANGMVKRFNGRIAEALAAHHCASCADLEALFQWYAILYNHALATGAGARERKRRRQWNIGKERDQIHGTGARIALSGQGLDINQGRTSLRRENCVMSVKPRKRRGNAGNSEYVV